MFYFIIQLHNQVDSDCRRLLLLLFFFLGRQKQLLQGQIVWGQFCPASRTDHDSLGLKWETQLFSQSDQGQLCGRCWLRAISCRSMLLEGGFTKPLKVTRQLVNAQRRVDLIIASFFFLFTSVFVLYTMRNISAKYTWNKKTVAFIRMWRNGTKL